MFNFRLKYIAFAIFQNFKQLKHNKEFLKIIIKKGKYNVYWHYLDEKNKIFLHGQTPAEEEITSRRYEVALRAHQRRYDAGTQPLTVRENHLQTITRYRAVNRTNNIGDTTYTHRFKNNNVVI